MKKAFVILLGLSSFSIASAGRDIITQNVNELPEKARTTLKEQFSNEEVSFIKIDRDFIRKSYEVQFASGNEVAFNNKGEWTEIEFDNSQFPCLRPFSGQTKLPLMQSTISRSVANCPQKMISLKI